MVKRKWFTSANFLLIVLSALGAAIVAATEELTKRLFNNKKGGKKPGKQHKDD